LERSVLATAYRASGAACRHVQSQAIPKGRRVNMSKQLPTGTVTFMFTDIEGSTRLLRRLGDAYVAANDRHLALLRTSISETGGTVVRTEGDAFFAAFPTAAAAVEAAVAGQRALAQETWPGGVTITVRMGLHTGEGSLGGDDYVGIDVVRAARIADAGHGGQVLVSQSTAALVAKDLPEGVRLRELGPHELKDLASPEELADLVVDGLPQDFPPLRTRAVRGQLPERLGSFIGREGLLAQALGLLDGTRVLTLVGPGGTGKTRLAIRLAEEAGPDFADGFFFVPLSPVSDPSLAVSAILQSLGVRGPDTSSPLERLRAHLRDASVLLVLDNLEQILEVGKDVSAVLEAAPGVKVVATSRAPLGIAGEQQLPVPPMDVPNGERPVAELGAVESIRLFTERAAAKVPGFQITEENAPALVELTKRLNGLPLALELAANKVKMMSPAEIARRLELRILSGGGSDVEPRQQSMSNAIAWSYELLPVEQAALLRRLGVFHGGARLAEIEAVCRPESDLGIDTLDGLEALIDQSLVQVRYVDESRYGMLNVLREFAYGRLTDDERGELQERHADAYLALAETAEPELSGRDRRAWFDLLEREIDNLRAAIGYFVDHQRADEAMRLGSALWRLWQTRGMLHEARSVLGEVLRLEGGSSLSRMRAYEAMGGTAYWQSDYVTMTDSYQRALDFSRELGDPLEEANALYNMSYEPALGGDTERAIARLEEARAIYLMHPDPVGLSNVLSSLAVMRESEGQYQAALEAAEQAIEIARTAGNHLRLSWALFSAAYLAFEADDPVGLEYLDESLLMFERDNDLSGIAFALGASALRSLATEDEPGAARLYGAALRHMEIADTSLFLTGEQDRARLAALASLVERHPVAFEQGRAMATGEAIGAARRQLGLP
jgi:predicted ATPase/class 3 adenylate cyclase